MKIGQDLLKSVVRCSCKAGVTGRHRITQAPQIAFTTLRCLLDAMSSLEEDIRLCIARVHALRSGHIPVRQSQPGGSWYAPVVYVDERVNPNYAASEHSCVTFGSSATAHSATFDEQPTHDCFVGSFDPPFIGGARAEYSQFPAADGHISTMLPCEFQGFTACPESFRLEDVGLWIDHMVKRHLGRCFPLLSQCWFCDEVEFRSPSKRTQDKEELYRQRMLHIHGHYVRSEAASGIRPDFFFLDHLHQNGLIEEEVFQRACQRGEFPRNHMPHDRYGGTPSRAPAYEICVETHRHRRRQVRYN